MKMQSYLGSYLPHQGFNIIAAATSLGLPRALYDDPKYISGRFQFLFTHVRSLEVITLS